MKVYWLSVLPLVGALLVAVLRRWRMVMVVLGLATILAGLALLRSLPLDEVTTLLEQEWLLDSTKRLLLGYVYVGTALLLAVAATIEDSETVFAPVLASLGVLSAVLLLRSVLVSLLLVPAALALVVLATPSKCPMATHGAARFMVWVTLPIPFLLAAFWPLDQAALHPQEVALTSWSPWLVLPAAILWLSLFPFNVAISTWAKGGPPFAPAFVWLARDSVVFYALLSLWRQVPLLQSTTAMSVWSTFGLLTMAFSGLWAVMQSSASAVLACAAMSVLGFVVRGVAVGSREGLEAATFLLAGRSAVVLLTSSSLAGLYSLSGGGALPTPKRLPWQGLLLLLIFVVGVLALIGYPVARPKPMMAFLQSEEALTWQVWRISAAAVVIGLGRASWRLWQERVRVSAGRVRTLPFLMTICLLLLCIGAYLRFVSV